MAFAIPANIGWTLPAYELALLTAHRADPRVSISIVTPEDEPLAAFGGEASAEVRRLLEETGLRCTCARRRRSSRPASLARRPGDKLQVERVVALPRLAAREPW